MYESLQKFRARLAAGQVCLGASISLSDPAVTEALGPSCDFFWIDLEHSPLGLESLQGHLIAARATGTPALVRVPSSAVAWIKRVLDTGAGGVIVPQVRSAAEVRQVVADCRYAPAGARGYGPRRAALYGQIAGADYLQHAQRDLFVAVQIENAAALEQIDEIAACEHLDSIVLGPWDLSFALGLPGQVSHPDVRRALSRIVAAARGAGKFVGSGCGCDAAIARQLLQLGVQWLQLGGDTDYLQHAAQSVMNQVRG